MTGWLLLLLLGVVIYLAWRISRTSVTKPQERSADVRSESLPPLQQAIEHEIPETLSVLRERACADSALITIETENTTQPEGIHRWPQSRTNAMLEWKSNHRENILRITKDSEFHSGIIRIQAIMRPLIDQRTGSKTILASVDGLHVGLLAGGSAAKFHKHLAKHGLEGSDTLGHLRIDLLGGDSDPLVSINIPDDERPAWPNGSPVKTHTLPDGRTRNHMQDGRILTVPAFPSHVIEYLSTWIDSEPGETYSINASFSGLSMETGFVEVWNYDIGEVRNYAFHKISSVTCIEDGKIHSGYELSKELGGKYLE